MHGRWLLMQKKSGQVALGGIATGMCIALMFATGMIPFSYYALPALAGLVLIAVREENGLSTALIVFAAVSLLSVFVVPIKEAALLFIAFFGYYPILQETFAKIRPKALSWVVRLVIFNAAVVAAYWVIVNVFGITEILEEFGDFGKYSVLVLLAFANVFFVIYDGAVKNITLSYDITSPKLKRINITRIQPYISLQNFITWTGYSGYDPEVSQSESATQMGIDWGTYPNVRTVVVGLNLTF
jgi:hypothetical protein